MPTGYVPARGDFIWLEFSPQAGHRPAFVISPEPYNRKTGLALVCPITNQTKGYPFEVLVPPGLKVKGAILSDQIKSLDWRARHATFLGKAPAPLTAEVLSKSTTLLS